MSRDNNPGGPAVYSRDRVKRLRIVLWLALVLGVFVSILQAGVLGDPTVDQQLTRIALAIYLVVAVSSGVTLWLLVRRDVVTRLIATATGAFLAIVGVLTTATIFGWLSLLLGLGVLLLAVLPDDPGRER